MRADVLGGATSDAFSSPDHEKRRATLEQFRRRTTGQDRRDDDGGPGATDRIRALRRLREDSPSVAEHCS
jgi:hypothetical protein